MWRLLFAVLGAALGQRMAVGIGKGDITGPVVQVAMMGYADPRQKSTGFEKLIFLIIICFRLPLAPVRALLLGPKRRRGRLCLLLSRQRHGRTSSQAQSHREPKRGRNRPAHGAADRQRHAHSFRPGGLF